MEKNNKMTINDSLISQERSSIAVSSKYVQHYLNTCLSKISYGYDVLYVQIDSVTKIILKEIYSVFFIFELIEISTNNILCNEKTPVRTKDLFYPSIGFYVPAIRKGHIIRIKACSGTYNDFKILGLSSFDVSKVVMISSPQKAVNFSIEFLLAEDISDKSSAGILNLKACWIDVSPFKNQDSDNHPDTLNLKGMNYTDSNSKNVLKGQKISNFQMIIRDNVNELLQTEYVYPKHTEVGIRKFQFYNLILGYNTFSIIIVNQKKKPDEKDKLDLSPNKIQSSLADNEDNKTEQIKRRNAMKSIHSFRSKIGTNSFYRSNPNDLGNMTRAERTKSIIWKSMKALTTKATLGSSSDAINPEYIESKSNETFTDDSWKNPPTDESYSSTFYNMPQTINHDNKVRSPKFLKFFLGVEKK